VVLAVSHRCLILKSWHFWASLIELSRLGENENGL
jgi:hypothetical protein